MKYLIAFVLIAINFASGQILRDRQCPSDVDVVQGFDITQVICLNYS